MHPAHRLYNNTYYINEADGNASSTIDLKPMNGLVNATRSYSCLSQGPWKMVQSILGGKIEKKTKDVLENSKYLFMFDFAQKNIFYSNDWIACCVQFILFHSNIFLSERCVLCGMILVLSFSTEMSTINNTNCYTFQINITVSLAHSRTKFDQIMFPF